MKQLYLDTDHLLLIQYKILPYFDQRYCKKQKRTDFDNILLIDKTLNNALKKKHYLHLCKSESIASKKICTIHCKARPLYQYIQLKFKTFQKNIQWSHLHFPHKSHTKLFKKMYPFIIYYGTCCNGNGLKLRARAGPRGGI